MKDYSRCWYRQISKNKGIELEVGWWRTHWSWLVASVRITRMQDHAGFYLSIEIVGLFLNLTIYDHRHWDVEKSCFYNEEEEEKEV